MVNFHNLPVDILLFIASICCYPEICCLAGTCKYFKKILHQKIILKSSNFFQEDMLLYTMEHCTTPKQQIYFLPPLRKINAAFKTDFSLLWSLMSLALGCETRQYIINTFKILPKQFNFISRFGEDRQSSSTGRLRCIPPRILGN